MPAKVVSQDEWLQARLDLLEKEKEHTRNADKLADLRASLPMVKVPNYTMDGPGGKKVTLAEMFEGRKQLIVYHFMLGPSAKAGCSGCSFLTDEFPHHPEHLKSRQTTLVLVSRAPIEKIQDYQKRMGWVHYPWYSSHDTNFNYDFNVTQDESVKPAFYNYMDKEKLESKGLKSFLNGELPGLSVFMKEGEDVFHTYSSYARGLDHLSPTTAMLDLTPLGRQEKEDKKVDFKLHDEYTTEDLEGKH